MPKRKGKWYIRLKRNLCICQKEKTVRPAHHVHLDDKLNKELDNWAAHHKNHLETVEQRKAVELLKSQLEEYQYELEQRKQRVAEENSQLTTMNKSKTLGKHLKHHKHSDTDDRLPYEQKPIALTWKKAFEKMKSLRSQQESLTTNTESTLFQVAEPPVVDTSRSDLEELEHASHLTDLVTAMLEDNRIEADSTYSAQLSNAELAALSRNDMKEFEHTMMENTKECLFISLPTAEELENWEHEEARPDHMKKHRKKIEITKKNIVDELRIFCPNCKPRHWYTTCRKLIKHPSWSTQPGADSSSI